MGGTREEEGRRNGRVCSPSTVLHIDLFYIRSANSKYGQLDMRKFGTEYLSHTLHQHLSAHIKQHLPAVLRKLEAKCAQLSEMLNAYDQTGDEDRLKLINRLITAVSDRFSEPLLGRRVLISTLMSGPRINDIYHTEFPKVLTPDKPDEAELMKNIGNAQRNLAGTHIQVRL